MNDEIIEIFLVGLGTEPDRDHDRMQFKRGGDQ
jgi:hypothetical protein